MDEESGRALICYAGSAPKASTDSMSAFDTELECTNHSSSGSQAT